MPPPLDITGERFGSLIALCQAPREENGQSRRWVCLCDCGAQTIVPLNRLRVPDDNPRSVRACETCRSKPCSICGELFLKAGRAATCGSQECRAENRRIIGRAYVAMLESAAPETLKQWRKASYARVRENPVSLAARRESVNASQRRRTANLTEDERDRRREYNRAYYSENREKIREHYTEWFSALPPERKKEIRAQVAAAGRNRSRRNALAIMLRDLNILAEKS